MRTFCTYNSSNFIDYYSGFLTNLYVSVFFKSLTDTCKLEFAFYGKWIKKKKKYKLLKHIFFFRLSDFPQSSPEEAAYNLHMQMNWLSCGMVVFFSSSK